MKLILSNQVKLLVVAACQLYMQNGFLGPDNPAKQLAILRTYSKNGCQCGCGTNYPKILGYKPDQANELLSVAYKKGHFTDLQLKLISMSVALTCPDVSDLEKGNSVEWDDVAELLEGFRHLVLHWKKTFKATSKELRNCSCFDELVEKWGDDLPRDMYEMMKDLLYKQPKDL